MLNGSDSYYREIKSGKKLLAHGKGISNMFKKSHKLKLTNSNSTLIVRDSSDLNSEYWIVSR